MSLTFSRVPDGEDYWGRTHTTLYDVKCDTSYPLTNGYVINATDVGLKFFKSAKVEGQNKAAGALLPMLDFGTMVASNAIEPTKIALRVFYPTGGATAPASLSAPSATATPASGATAVTSTAAQPAIPVTGVAGLAKEVADTTDLSTLTFRVRFLG